jgi:uncharacterized spore protein YtfJ
MSLAKILQSWTETLERGASVKNVFGEPIELAGRTLVPVARVAFGFGAGRGHGKDDSSDKSAEEGGGGGASAKPIGVLEVTDAGTKFIPTRGNGRLYAGIAAGFIVGLWMARRR